MKQSNMKIPIALQKETNLLVNAKDVPNGKECNCFCFNCGGDLVAINQEIVQGAHFRHSSDADCSFKNNYESYIHWLAKKVFSELKYIYLPEIGFKDLKLDSGFHNTLTNEFRQRLASVGMLESFQDIKLSLYNVTLQKPSKVQIQSFEIEKLYKTELGDIRVDIVLNIGNTSLFIEPFFTSQIDTSKFQKIRSLDVSTISINLLAFIEKYYTNFTIDQFRSFLITDIGQKKWIYVRNSKTRKLADSVFDENFEKKLEQMSKVVHANKEIEYSIQEKTEKINQIQIEIYKLWDELKKVDIFDLFKR